jgi:phosphoribosylformylglycinamidine synthase
VRATVALFPGLNADAEMVRTLRDICGAPTRIAWHTDTELPDGTDLVAIPGGFSYGD